MHSTEHIRRIVNLNNTKVFPYFCEVCVCVHVCVYCVCVCMCAWVCVYVCVGVGVGVV